MFIDGLWLWSWAKKKMVLTENPDISINRKVIFKHINSLPGAGIVAQQVKSLLGIPATYIGMPGMESDLHF